MSAMKPPSNMTNTSVAGRQASQAKPARRTPLWQRTQTPLAIIDNERRRPSTARAIPDLRRSNTTPAFVQYGLPLQPGDTCNPSIPPTDSYTDAQYVYPSEHAYHQSQYAYYHDAGVYGQDPYGYYQGQYGYPGQDQYAPYYSSIHDPYYPPDAPVEYVNNSSFPRHSSRRNFPSTALPYGPHNSALPVPRHVGEYSGPSLDLQQTIAAGTFLEKLKQTVKTNQIQKFYPDGSLLPIAKHLSTIDFAAFAAEWRIPAVLCEDLISLALYDIIILCDDSGSMLFEDKGSRIAELRRILGMISKVASLFDEEGILIRFFNSPVQGNGIRNTLESDAVVSQVKFQGTTPMGSKLQSKVIDPFVMDALNNDAMFKPLLVFVITDGEPSGDSRDSRSSRDMVFDVIRKCRQHMLEAGYGRGVAFQFAQVGNDAAAHDFLSMLDNDETFGDVVDTTSHYEMQAEIFQKKGLELTPELWLLKVMMGSIDPTYDEQD